MSVDIILKDIEWDGVNKIRVPLEGGGTQDFSIGGGVTPTGNINITHSGQTDVTNYATATVPTADANAGAISSSYVTENNQRKWKFTYEGYAESPGWVDEGAFGSPHTYDYNAVPSNTTITPTTSAQTIGGQNYMMEGAVTVNAMPTGTAGTPTATKGTVSNHSVSVTPSVTNTTGYITGGTKTGNSVTVTANELASGNLPITANANNINVVGYASVSVNVPSASPNLQTKTRTYTPEITQQREVISADSGYDGLLAVGITVEAMPTLTLPNVASMTSSGTRKAKIYQSNYTQYWNIGTGYHAVAEYYEIPPLLVDTKTITTNGTYNAIDEDLDGYSSVTVNVPSGTSTCATKTMTNSDNQATSIEFTGLSGEPKWFFVRCTSQLTRSSSYSYYFVTAVRYNGTNHYGNYYRRSNGSFYNDTSHYSHTYSNGTLTVSSSANRGAAGGSFYNGGYELVYIY